MALGKVDVYNLGARGVNLTASPVHTEDGDVVSAQNAISNPVSEEGGLSKRGGLARLNSSALAGSVANIINVPLPVTLTRTLYAALDLATPMWRKSTDGTTWSNVTTVPARAQSNSKITGAGGDQIFNTHNRIVGWNRRLYYPANGYTQAAAHPSVRAFDGTNDYEVFTVPTNTAAGVDTYPDVIGDMIVHDNKLYLTVFDSGFAATDYSRVYEYDPSVGTLLQVGPGFRDGTSSVTGMASVLCSFQGRLWMGTNGGFGGGTALGQLYSIQPGYETTWTLEKSFTEGWVQSMAVYRGKLYVAVNNAVASASQTPKVYVRAADNTYAASVTGGTSVGTSWYSQLTVFNDLLFAAHLDNEASPDAAIKMYDGSSWTEDFDISGTYAAATVAGSFLSWQSSLYYVIPAFSSAVGAILKRTSAGVWPAVDATQQLRGFLAELVVEG